MAVICNITQHWAADLFQYSEAQTLSCGCSSECICTGEHYFASELVTNVVEGIYQTTMYFDSPLTADEIEKQMNNWKNSAMDAISTPLAEWADVTSIEKTCICE